MVSAGYNVQGYANPDYFGGNGILYQQYPLYVHFNSGQSTQFNFQMMKKTPPTSFVGRLTDAVTGQPIPNAVVSITERYVSLSGASYLQQAVTTDIFGRYVLPVNATVPSSNSGPFPDPSYLSIYTNGAFLPSSLQAQSPYVAKTLQEGNKIVGGDILNLNISLRKKQQ